MRRVLAESGVPSADQDDAGRGCRPPLLSPAAREAAMLAEWLKQPPDPSFTAAPPCLLARTL